MPGEYFAPLPLGKTEVDVLDQINDSDAIHDNVASEISAITEKATPVDADLALIEDSAASFIKKKISLDNLPSHAPAAHTVASHSDTSGTGTELNTLTDGSDADALHSHPALVQGDVVYVAAENEGIDISETSDVTIGTTDVTGVAAGDIIIAELYGTLLQNSGDTRNMVFTPDFDGVFDAELTRSYGASSDPTWLRIRWILSVSSASSATFMAEYKENPGQTAGTWDGSTTAEFMVHEDTATDMTGTITVALNIRSAVETATQTFDLASFVVRKVSAT